MWRKPFIYFKEIRAFLIVQSIILSIALLIIFFGMYVRNNNLLIKTVREQAVSYFDLIVKTRLWNSNHGGVFVEKKPGVESNKYLKLVRVNPDIKTEDGRTFTMRNPAIMTREISQLTEKGNGVKIHITALKLANPQNKPDEFEKNALEQFEKGKKEVWTIDRSRRDPVFRYMAPLYIEKSCLSCHKHFGYKIGDIRGGISISIPIAGLDQSMATNRILIFGMTLLTIGLLISILYFLVRKLVYRLDAAQRNLQEMAIVDDLTNLYNRRYIIRKLDEEFQQAKRLEMPLSVIMLDIDHFKQINDTYGHLFGDVVLTEIAFRMKSSLRGYDILGRFGGEEFIIVSPGCPLYDAIDVAERIRDIVKSKEIRDGNQSVRVTLSAGIATLTAEDKTVDALLVKADNALYKAKEEGRDKVAVL